jgi:hypothetical protein
MYPRIFSQEPYISIIEDRSEKTINFVFMVFLIPSIWSFHSSW